MRFHEKKIKLLYYTIIINIFLKIVILKFFWLTLLDGRDFGGWELTNFKQLEHFWPHINKITINRSNLFILVDPTTDKSKSGFIWYLYFKLDPWLKFCHFHAESVCHVTKSKYYKMNIIF